MSNFMDNEDHIQGKDAENWKHFLQESRRQGQKIKACFPEMVTFKVRTNFSLQKVSAFWSVSKWWITHPEEKDHEQLKNMTSD